MQQTKSKDFHGWSLVFLEDLPLQLLFAILKARWKNRLQIAAFIPVVVYMADAVGTQTQTIFIRSLALTHDLDMKKYIWPNRLHTVSCHITYDTPLRHGTFNIFYFSSNFTHFPFINILFLINLHNKDINYIFFRCMVHFLDNFRLIFSIFSPFQCVLPD